MSSRPPPRAAPSAEAKRIADGIKESAEIDERGSTTAREDVDVARELARLLRSDRFEQWVVNEALESLVDGASETLEQLSSNQYALGGRRRQRVRGDRPPQRRRAPLGQDALRRRDVPGVARALAGARRSGRRARRRRRREARRDLPRRRLRHARPRLSRHRRRNAWRRWAATPAWSASSPTCASSPTGCRCASRSRRVRARRPSPEWTRSAMKFSVDPWDVEYGASLDIDQPDARSAQLVVELELPSEEWHPIDAERRCERPGPDPVHRRRAPDRRPGLDRRRSGRRQPGLCASFAAGAVCCEERAEVISAEVGRGVFSTAPTATDIVTVEGDVSRRAWPRRPTPTVSCSRCTNA